MSIIRGFASGILSFFLVITLFLLGIAITINATVLNPDFVIDEINKLDVYSIITDQIADQLKAQIPVEEPYVEQTLDEVLVELEPWLKDQTSTVINAGYAYLKEGKELSLVVELEPVRSTLKTNLREAILESPPPELEGATESEIEDFLSIAYAEIDNQIPPSFELSQNSLDPEIVAQLEQARQIIGYIDIGYKALIGLALLFCLLIALIHWWRAKPICLSIGIAFTIGGLISYLGTLAVSRLAGQVNQGEIPVELQAKLPQLFSDFVAPLQIYGIVVLVVGVGLIVLSILLKPTAE